MLCHQAESPQGDVINHYLANNIWEPHHATRRTVGVSAVYESQPMARNTFTITPVGKEQGESKEDVIRYGDRFYLASNPSLRAEPSTRMVSPPFYLASERPSAIHGTGSGRRQEVFMTLNPGPACEWQVWPADGQNLAREGQPVPANAETVLVHTATNQALAIIPTERFP